VHLHQACKDGLRVGEIVAARRCIEAARLWFAENQLGTGWLDKEFVIVAADGESGNRVRSLTLGFEYERYARREKDGLSAESDPGESDRFKKERSHIS